MYVGKFASQREDEKGMAGRRMSLYKQLDWMSPWLKTDVILENVTSKKGVKGLTGIKVRRRRDTGSSFLSSWR